MLGYWAECAWTPLYLSKKICFMKCLIAKENSVYKKRIFNPTIMHKRDLIKPPLTKTAIIEVHLRGFRVRVKIYLRIREGFCTCWLLVDNGHPSLCRCHVFMNNIFCINLPVISIVIGVIIINPHLLIVIVFIFLLNPKHVRSSHN